MVRVIRTVHLLLPAVYRKYADVHLQVAMITDVDGAFDDRPPMMLMRCVNSPELILRVMRVQGPCFFFPSRGGRANRSRRMHWSLNSHRSNDDLSVFKFNLVVISWQIRTLSFHQVLIYFSQCCGVDIGLKKRHDNQA